MKLSELKKMIEEELEVNPDGDVFLDFSGELQELVSNDVIIEGMILPFNNRVIYTLEQ